MKKGMQVLGLDLEHLRLQSFCFSNSRAEREIEEG
jgi:hypothetical protein